MNFLNIKYFLAIAEEKNISAAARKLYVSQQSLSEHLKKLEAEFGVPLFDRGSSLTLTVAGECFYDGAKEILKTYDRMVANIDAATVHRRSRISIAHATYGCPPFLADLLVQFTENFPQYDVTVVKRLHTDVSHSMRGVDLYISSLPLDKNLAAIPILEHDPYYVVFHRDLPRKVYGAAWPELEQRLLETKDLGLLKDMPFCLLHDRLGQLALDQSYIFSEYNFTPKTGFYSESNDLNIQMCQKGKGCVLSPDSTIRRQLTIAGNDFPQDMLCYPITVTSFEPCLAICHEKGKHLHDAEICFIREARALLANSTTT